MEFVVEIRVLMQSAMLLVDATAVLSQKIVLGSRRSLGKPKHQTMFS